jgi:hypothetical protein
MGWITVPGLAGRVYAPDDEKTQKKHPCSGCFSCQWCDENRCRVCQGRHAAANPRAVCRIRKIPPSPSFKTGRP